MGQGAYWLKHPKKELQALLMRFHRAGWLIFDPPKYYKCYCVCAEKHKTTVHLTPSGGSYIRNKTQWLERQPCYKDNKGKEPE